MIQLEVKKNFQKLEKYYMKIQMSKVLFFNDFCEKKCKSDEKCKENCKKILKDFFKDIFKTHNNINISYT